MRKLRLIAALLFFGLFSGHSHALAAVANDAFDLALMEASALSQVELSRLPCKEQVSTAAILHHGGQTPDNDTLALWTKQEFQETKAQAVDRVAKILAGKYPTLSADQSTSLRATSEYILLAAPLASCEAPASALGDPFSTLFSVGM